MFFFFFFFFLSWLLWNQSVCHPLETAIPLSSGFSFHFFPLLEKTMEFCESPRGFWSSEGQALTSEEKGNLIENRGYLWFIQRNFSSPSSYLPGDLILCGSSEPTVRWFASAALDLFQIFSKDKHPPYRFPQLQWLSCLGIVFWLI